MKHERLVFVGAALGLWLLFVVQAWNSPVLLDDWYQLTYWRHHDYGLQALWDYGHYNYFNFNPRIGDVFLVMVNGPRAVHLVVTPIVQLAVLPTAFAAAFGRWPRATLRDLQLLLVIQVLIWLVIPVPGIIYFYRPFATNYLWAFTLMLALFAPYRIALAGDDSRRRLWLVPIMFVLGWIAGMGNEHTGPTAMVAIAAFVIAAWKRRRLRAWMVSGALGLWIGYPMLFFAPGQTVRYAGLAERNTPTVLLRDRGFDGCFEILLDFLSDAKTGILVFVVALLVYLGTVRRRGAAVPEVSKRSVVTAALLLLASGAIIVTLFASPTASERMFYASGILLVCAFAVFLEHMFAERRVRRFVVIACAIIFAYHAFRFVQTYIEVKAENDDRIALLRAAKPGTVAHVPPYEHRRRSRWHWGDDFRYASLREYVGNEVFDLANIEITEYMRTMQPSPTDHYVATRVYDPPLAEQVAPVAYIPTYWEWTLAQLRRLLWFTQIGDYQGHELVRYTITAAGVPFEDPEHRPIVVVDWTPSGYEFVDGRPYDDRQRRSYLRVWKKSLPQHLTDSWIVGCGRTYPVEPIFDGDDVGPRFPVRLECRGLHTLLTCEPDRCWLAGRYWR